jgi:TRAP-type C4-dicarboxylate transport system substrate-binding protein
MRVLLFSLLLMLSFAAQAFTLRISTLYPDGTSAVTALQQAGKDIARKTDSRVQLHIYAGGVMGDDKAVQRKIRIGQLQGTLAQGGAFARYYRDSQVYNLPLVFRSYDEVNYVRHQLDPVLVKGFEENGWVTFGFVDGGFAYLMTQNPVASVTQLQQQKVWLPSADAGSAAAAKVYGLSPVLLPISDVLASLQTGVINALVAPPVAALTLQWFTKVKYITQVPLLYTYGMLAISKSQFDRISPSDRKIVTEVLNKTFAEMDTANRLQNHKAFDAIKNQGLEIITPTAKELAVWRDYAARARTVLAQDGQVSQAMQDKLDALLKDYRASH